MTILKPWKSMPEQLALLKARGLLVDNEPAALDYLARIGYYRLSGYWYLLREIDREASLQYERPVRSDHFVPGSHFEDVVRLYVFDKKLRLMALDALERIEMALRVDVAHLLAVICPNSTWAQRLIDLLRDGVTSSHQLLALEDFGAIEGWEQWLLQGQK